MTLAIPMMEKTSASHPSNSSNFRNTVGFVSDGAA
jgi:hypothetical protein